MLRNAKVLEQANNIRLIFSRLYFLSFENKNPSFLVLNKGQYNLSNIVQSRFFLILQEICCELHKLPNPRPSRKVLLRGFDRKPFAAQGAYVQDGIFRKASSPSS